MGVHQRARTPSLRALTPAPPTATLAERLAAIDEQRFVGRAAELTIIDGLLEEGPARSVVLVYGPGGIGKSSLLREVARRAAARGRPVLRIDGRDLAPVPDALGEALGEAHDMPGPVVLIDAYDAVFPLGRHLRASVLPALAADALLVVASRRPPDPGWFENGWEHMALAMPLNPLSAEDAGLLLAERGVTDSRRRRSIMGWARGSPLALALAGDVDADLVVDPHAPNAELLVDGLVRALVGAEVRPGQRAVLGVAAVARVITTELLAAVLPERDPEADMAWLAELTFTEPRGDGLTLHVLTARAVRADLRRREDAYEHELRRRIADFLHARAVEGRLELSIDLAHLVEDPVIRWGYSWEGSDSHRIDDVRPGDAAAVMGALGRRGRRDWRAGTERWFAEAPGCIFVVRDRLDEVCGYATAMTPASAPALARADPQMGPWLAHAEASGGSAVLWRDSIDFTHGDGSVQAMLGLAGILRSGLSNPRYAYLPVDPRMTSAMAFAEALKATHLPELDSQPGAPGIQCHRIDYGPGGLLGAQRDVVYREIGLAPAAATKGPVTLIAVREALREFRSPQRLAQNPLAEGVGVADRSASVRELLTAGAARAFGDSDGERLMHAVLVRGYLEPAPSHELAADELHVSRSTYFRRLQGATERLAAELGAADLDGA